MSVASLVDDDVGVPSHLIPLTEPRRKLIHAMVWLGLNNRDSGKHAGISETATYKALHSPDFQKALETELKVRRKSARLGNIPALERVRDNSANPMAVVAAAKVLEQIGDDGMAASSNDKPGYVIGIPQHLLDRLSSGAQSPPLIDATPNALKSHDDVGPQPVQRAREHDDEA